MNVINLNPIITLVSFIIGIYNSVMALCSTGDSTEYYMVATWAFALGAFIQAGENSND